MRSRCALPADRSTTNRLKALSRMQYALSDKKPLVDQRLDRLQHHYVNVRIDGPSRRAPASPAGAPSQEPAAPDIKHSTRSLRPA